MLNSLISIQSSPLEPLISAHRSPINAQRPEKRDNELPNHVSSLYEQDPYPDINFHHDPTNRWESIAKDVLTPFAPKHAIYNYKKFLPAKYRGLASPIISPTSALVENKNHFMSKPAFSRKVSFADNAIQLLLTNVGDQEEKEFEQKLFRNYISGSQTSRYEHTKPQEISDTKKQSTLKKFLVERPPSQNNFLDMRQIQIKGKSRPQTAAESLKKDMARTLFIEANGITVGNCSDEGSRHDKDSSDSATEKENSTQGKLMPHPKILAAIKASRDTGKLPNQGSRRSLLITDKPFIARNSFQKDDKSREGSTRNDSKFSVFFRKGAEAEDEGSKSNKKVQPQSNIRRKSDTSQYSGGECVKLSKHIDIILPSDSVKRFARKTPSPSNDRKKEAAGVLNILQVKRRNDLEKKKEGRSIQVSPRNTPNIPCLETINSTQAIKANENEARSPPVDHFASRKTFDLALRARSVSQARAPHLRAITPITTTNKMLFSIDGFPSVIKSKTPGGSRESSRGRNDVGNDKAFEVQTDIRSARHGKSAFEKRLKHGDLSGALQVVLDLNKKAQKTVFVKKVPEKIKTSRPISKKIEKDENKYGNKGDLEKESNSSPYVQPMGLRKGDIKGGLYLGACESIQEEAPKQTKKKMRRKFKFLSSRSKSVPKINELPMLEKIYL